MKKKLYSIVSMFMILFACLFASACGDKYSKLEFRVLYAYTQNAEEWFDGSEGISLNYSEENWNGEGDETSLVFNDQGVATLCVKIEIKNVKKKHVDSITVSFASFNNLDFSSKRVKQGEVFEIPIRDNVETTLKLYENNSNKKAELPFVISRELESISADLTKMPAMSANGTLNLFGLNNLKYNPQDKTNQFGVTYSVESIGYYDNSKTFIKTIESNQVSDYVVVADGRLVIIDGSFFDHTAYVIRVRATSIFHDGVEDDEDLIYADFDVYVAESNVSAPVVKFADGRGNKVNSQINIYDNGGDYATSTIYVDKALLSEETRYYSPLNTHDGVVSYGVAVYVLNANNEYERYKFGSEEHQSGINGLIVEELENYNYKFSIVDRTVERNKVKFVYTIDGLDFSSSSHIYAEKTIEVVKSVVPTCITINDSLDLAGGTQYATIYGTSSSSYKGLQLKISANPNDDPNRIVEVVDQKSGLSVIGERNNTISSQIANGETIFVKFKNNITETQMLTLKTLKVPTYYNEQDITNQVQGNDNNYIIVNYSLTKLVTADSFQFIKNEAGEETNNAVIDADNGGNVYVKVYYNGVNLDASTIKLESDNDAVVFANGLKTIALNESGVVLKSSSTDNNGKFNIYAIGVKASNGTYSAKFTITAGDGTVGVEKSISVSTVYLLPDATGINVQGKTSNVRKFNVDEVNNGAFNFAIGNREFAEFSILANGKSNAIAKIELSALDVQGEEFSSSAVSFNVISNSTFVVLGRIGGKTQVLKATIYYYDLINGVIETCSTEREIQIAVYEGIGNIKSVLTKSMIGYVNPYYKETSSTEINFSSFTANGGSPASSVSFKSETGVIDVSKASQIQIGINAYESIKNSGVVKIEYVGNGKTINLLNSKSTILQQEDVDLLSGKIVVELTGSLSSLNEISISISALRFGVVSNVVTNSVIKIAKVDLADRILVSGENIIATSDTSNKLELSFIDVADGSYDEKDFNASIQFESAAMPNSLRFENVETALTYILYKYEMDDNGNIKVNDDGSLKLSRIPNDFFSVTFNNGKINVRAYKSRGGGLFKLVLATKDSYNLADNPEDITIEEEHFEKTYPLTIEVSDGNVGSEYVIENEETLALINYNLNSHFVLGANIVVSNRDFAPLGLVNGLVQPFKGSLSGYRTTIVGQDEAHVTAYSITMNINSSALSTEFGTLYGLFAILDDSAVVKNLKMNVVFANNFENASLNGAKVGAVAGVNNGTISNVSANISANEELKFDGVTAGNVDFGGLTGVNNGRIEKPNINCNNQIVLSSNSSRVYNIGLVSGTNKGTISGTYVGKESLNDFVFDVVANVSVFNNEVSGEPNYNAGSVAGLNEGTIENLLVGGQITVGDYEDQYQTGTLGGVVGKSNGGTIKTTSVLSLNLTAKSAKVDVAGVVGETSNTNVDNVKYISVETIFNGFTSLGEIKGENLVAGIIAKSTNGSLTNSSVESFVEYVEIYQTKEVFYTLKNGKTTAGLIAKTNAISVEKSFVKANISSSGNVNLTTDNNETNTYFIGKVDGTNLTNKSTYSIDVNAIDLETYMISIPDASILQDWKNVYVINNGNYVKAESYVDGETYKLFNFEAWVAYAQAKVGAVTDWNDDANWALKENYNVVDILGIDLFFPYLLDANKKPIMIIAPNSISANFDQTYTTKHNAVHVDEFDWADYNVVESIIVNYFNGAKDEFNTHKLISNDAEHDGLIDVTLLPEDAQGLFKYEIIGAGRNFAYINTKNEIVFTGVSGQTPILLRIYSGFNPDVEVYVVIYTQSLLTDLKINSGSVTYSNQDDYQYEINAYTGKSNTMISLDAENEIAGNKKYVNVFNVYGLSQYLEIGFESNASDSLLEVQAPSYNNITFKIKDDVKVSAGYSEIITFSLYLNKEYFGTYEADGSENYFLTVDRVEIAKVALKVHLYNSAKGIEVNGEDEEKTTHDDISFDVYLTTDYIDTTPYDAKDVVVESAYVDEEGNICLAGVETHDSIKISLQVSNGENEVEKLISNVNKNLSEDEKTSHFAELFDLNSAVVSRLYLPENETDKTKAIGYIYNVILELKDEHNYRYIENNINFSILVCAASNAEVSNENDKIEILMKPTILSTARIENYAVKTLNVNTDYTDIVTNQDIQTSIIEPGSLGNVMMIYLEPSYSNVVSASIKTSSLNVPSLGKDVKMKFTQLVLDQRKGGKGNFTTLYGANVPSQEDDTLELQLVSTIDKDSNRIYNGVICVYIQLEKFSGLEATMTVELNVETSNNTIVTRSRELLTTYLPGTKMIYNQEKLIDGGYLIQKGTSNNEVKIKIYGYQFNSNPQITFAWELPENATLTYVDATNKQEITDGVNSYLIGDYISYTLNKNYDEVVFDPSDNSYTLPLMLNVSEDIVAAFRVMATLSLTTKDGQINTSEAEENKIVFYPTDYILNSVYVDRLSNGRKNVPINKTSSLELMFTTDNEINDLTEEIYADLLEYVSVDGKVNKAKLAKIFSYYKNGGTITFADEELHPEFEFNVVNNKTISILGVSKFSNIVELNIWFGYGEDENGLYKLNFGENGEDGITTSLTFSFTLNIFAINEENEIPIYSADEIYNSSNGTWDLVEGVHYVLMNDIELENVVPITTAIGGLDGNNRVISIKSFAVNPAESEFGLFGRIGTYTIQDQETEENITKQTLLKNVIVDYSKFNGTIALNNNTAENIVFGGLVANNNGGLIYNCDVINLNAATDVQVDVVVASNSNVVFGGLVGTNSGIITNSRVGRDKYTRIVATKTTESSTVKRLGGLTYSIFNSENENDKINQFKVTAGGFVGINNGTISTSYVANTNLINYSTNETSNITAGFVGSNSGKISYSYVKADESTLTTTNPYSTGYTIENKGNGIVSGFVYSNTGEISNAYANVELQTKSAYISGFVYNNTGNISVSYAATTMNSGDQHNNAEQPFVGVDNAGNLLSNGTLKNTYYLMRSANDTPYKQGDKDIAQALNQSNFQVGEYLVGFSFVLSDIKADREQGIWSYYTTENKIHILPELINANVIAHSHRYIIDDEESNKVLTNAKSYAEGTSNNPYIISSVSDYTKVFTEYGQSPSSQVGYIRFINNIDFNNEETAIKTRSNYTLGSSVASVKTSVEGNGLTISGIYLDVDNVEVDTIGMFGEIKNAYIKNLDLEFATPTTNGQFSTTTAMYSGGLAGKIADSAILNIKLHGNNTTLTGSNFVGGVAGLISGKSLVYGIETNLNVKASSNEDYLYYNEYDYDKLNIRYSTYMDYAQYEKKLSYAGGIAGVLDLTTKSNVDYNVQFIDIRGDLMAEKTFEGKKEANMLAEYVGGVAGYASKETNSFKLKYFTGSKEVLRGDTAVGGLFGINLGGIVASQVTAEEDTQYVYDTEFGEYIIGLANNENVSLDKQNVGNIELLQGSKYVGGLVGVGLNSKIRATYSKVGIKSGEIVGGLVGLSVASVVNYSYAIPYLNSYDGYKSVGGFIGASYGIESRSPSRNSAIAEFEALLKFKGVKAQNTDIQFTYSTIIVDTASFEKPDGAVLDYICADYRDVSTSKTYLQSNSNTNLTYVYAGTVSDGGIVSNQTVETSKSAIMELFRLYNVGDPDQTVAFQEVFSGWSIVKYWSLREEKYFPLLINEAVENYIEIDSAEDIDLIRNNPEGNFKVIDDFTIDIGGNNWVIEPTFSGILLGEKEDGRRPTITIMGLKPNKEDTAGFFKKTEIATISNIRFVWDSNSNIAIKPSKQLSMVSGLVCDDIGSLISNVEVSVPEGKQILGEDATIAGFGGIVGSAKNTNILGCVFAGTVEAKLLNKSGDVNVGGIVGYATTEDLKDYNIERTSVVNNSNCGSSPEINDEDAKKPPITAFDLTVSEENTTTVNIGGIAGHTINAAIASNSVGGVDYVQEYKYIDINLDIDKVKTNIYLGGAVGLGEDGLISNCNILTNITTVGTVSATHSVFVRNAGLAGAYNLSARNTLTTGINNCNVNATIETFDETGAILKTDANEVVYLATGVAEMTGYATMKQCLFTGEINTEGSDISVLYAAGAIAFSNAESAIDIEEVITYSSLNVGTKHNETKGYVGTSKIYAGGLLGQVGNVKISYSASWRQIVPITNSSADNIYVGGLIGLVEDSAEINNSYSISSIIADSIAANAIQHLNIGALIGSIEDMPGSVAKVETSNVFYSSDYALFADENYVDGKPLGTNLSAQTIINDKAWHSKIKTENGTLNSIWTSLDINGVNGRMPHVSALEEGLVQFGIIQANDYEEGLAMNPIQIQTSGNYSFDENYKYYLLRTESDTKTTTPTFSGNLNGVLIGQDLDFENTFTMGTLTETLNDATNGIDDNHFGIIPAVLKHSAISNLHVKISGKITLQGYSGIIAGLNNGVIFNCSVQGTGVTITGGANVGLITATNRGMVANCYSTAEIVDGNSTGTLGGIVDLNGGRLLSNYFTGYINAKTAGGILVRQDTSAELDRFIYNNYMAGVVAKANGENNFSGSVELDDDCAYANYIDTYSDIVYAHKHTDDSKTIIPTSTAALMSEGLLDGKWYFAVSSGTLNVDSSTFGYNYNYPVYRFNKINDTTDFVKEWKNQLYTGTGVVDYNEDVFVDEDGDGVDDSAEEFTLQERYDVLINSALGADNYYHAFKIPHLGVLTAVQSLLSEDRNYVVIYDLDGEIPTDPGVEKLYTGWKAVGAKETVNGFVNTNKNEAGEIIGGFNGVFITNRYYSRTLTDDKICSIQNLENQGLFANILDSYFADINFGGFNALNESGALGTNILPTTADGVIVYNVAFNKGSVITGVDDKYYAGLFGSLDYNDGDLTKESKLTIKKFISVQGTQAALKLTSENATAGLLVGKSSGTITLENQENDKGFMAWFDGNNYAGGLVGIMSYGKIIGNDSIVNICKTDAEDAGIDNYTNVLGGVVGKTEKTASDKANIIKNLTVRLYDSTGDVVSVLASSFGGVVGEANSKLNVEDFTLQIDGTAIEFKYQDESDIRYYGLVAGIQQNTIQVNGFNLETKGETLFYINVTGTSEGQKYNEDILTCGTGTFVGSQNGDLTVRNYNAPQVQLSAKGVPNLGGVSGYYKQGSVVLGLGAEAPALDLFILIGTTNVGGLFGYCDGSITSNSFAGAEEGDINLLNASAPYARILVDGTYILAEHKPNSNFGGLFGKWGSGVTAKGASTYAAEPTELKISNKNSIIIGYNEATYKYKDADFETENIGGEDHSMNEGWALNIGGIAGKMQAEMPNNVSLVNTAEIRPIKNIASENSIANAVDGGGVVNQICKAQNVGGLFGLYDSITSSVIYNTVNTADIYGYQNVGGIVGYAGNNMPVVILNDKAVVLEDGSLVYSSSGLGIGATLNTEYILKGKIVGAINVGGAVGYAGKNVTISQVYSIANVSGNANVGGLVGLAENTSIINNYVFGGELIDAVGNKFVGGTVKGVYYKSLFLDETTKEIYFVSYLPTSVGGFAGTITVTETSLDPKPQILHNVVDGVNVSSAKEAKEGATISTISNNMVGMSFAVGNNLASLNLNSKEIGYSFEKNPSLEFDKIETGYGGFAGTIDSDSVQNSIENNKNANYLNNINVEAQLGVNVGTYYGAYKSTTPIDIGANNVVIEVPQLFTSKGNILIDGAYNIGGIVGFINGSGNGENFELDNEKLSGKAKILLQSRITGMYVGGLIGKTNANQIKNINIFTGKDIDISIDANSSYYVGGLIGRAEVSENAEINGDVKYGVVVGDEITNFGGLLGMLKVGESSGGLSVAVKGVHDYAFTINAIENSNYYDGDSKFDFKEENGEIQLLASAYYVNKDSFDIVGTSNPNWYNSSATNPLNDKAKGWAKEYTGFKQLQRCIKQDAQIGWDSISVLYDAEYITHVKIISGNIPWSYNVDDGTIEYKTVTDYISYTIYEQEPGIPTLYSRLGIGTAMLDYVDTNSDNVADTLVYQTPVDITAKWYDWLGAIFTEEAPSQTFYLDCLKNTTLRDLSYFKWYDKDIPGWAIYNTISNNEATIQNNTTGNTDNLHQAKHLVYFVEGYLDKTTSDEIPAATYPGCNPGIYFAFDTIFENSSSEPLVGSSEISDDYLPSSGSMFSVTGIYSETIDAKRQNNDAKNSFGIGVKIVKFIIEVIITVASFGTYGAAVIAQNGGKAALNFAMKQAFNKIKKAGARALGKAMKNKFIKGAVKGLSWGVKKLGKYAAIIIVMTIANRLGAQSGTAQNSQILFLKASAYNYGYLTTSYSRDIYYEQDDFGQISMKEMSDYVASSGQSYYIAYSSTRPLDYFEAPYIGCEIEASGPAVDASGAISFTNVEIKWLKNVDSSNMESEDTAYVRYSESDFETIYKNVSVTSVDGTKTKADIGVLDDGTKWLLSKTYEYRNGQYYINSFAADVNTHRVTLNFVPEKNVEGKDRKTPNYVMDSNNVYVHGKWSGTEYKYANWNGSGWVYNYSYPGNNLKYNGSKYTINDIQIGPEKVEENFVMNYAVDGYNNLDKVKENKDEHGYDYFDRAYYTAIGNTQMKNPADGSSLVKYARFKKYDGAISNNMIYGVDYVSGYYLIDETYSYIDPEDGLEKTGIREVSKGCYYTLVNEAFVTSVAADADVGYTDNNRDGYITIEMYPTTFVNPYTLYSSVLQNSSHDYDNGYTYYYTEQTTGAVLSHSVKYYIYEGGYTMDDDYNAVYLLMEENSYKSNEEVQGWCQHGDEWYLKLPNGKCYHDLIHDWNKNKEVPYQDGVIADYFWVKDGAVYSADTGYTIGEDGLLLKTYLDIVSPNSDFHKNMYLTNKSVGLYTRYMYSKNGIPLNLEAISEWGNTELDVEYDLIPTKGTSINNGRPTKLVESARVILNGNENIRLSGDGGIFNIQSNVGSITIS